MVVLSMTVAYNGVPFAGFARQPGQLTVQGSIEEALSLIFRTPIETVCAGRTDSGVHARGQVVSFSVPAEEWQQRSEYKFLRSMNALTHEDISIRSVEEREPGFSARFSATMREYRYFICTDKAAPLLMKNFCWHVPKDLDVAAMREAAAYLIGEHDFKSFCVAASAEGKSTMRNVFQVSVDHSELWGESLIVITVKGNAFLHSMVRTIVGTLVAVGTGHRTPDWVLNVLEARDRGAAGENAPAQGLVFWRVSYEGVRVHDSRAEFSETALAGGVLPPEKTVKGMDAFFEAAMTRAEERQQARGVARRGFGASRRNADMVVPRGDGKHIISGAGYSDVKDSEDAVPFDLSRDFMAYKNQSAAGEVRVIAEGGQFGEVLWDELGETDMDEPVVADQEAADAALAFEPDAAPAPESSAVPESESKSEAEPEPDDRFAAEDKFAHETAPKTKDQPKTSAKQTRVVLSDSAVVKSGPYPFQRR